MLHCCHCNLLCHSPLQRTKTDTFTDKRFSALQKMISLGGVITCRIPSDVWHIWGATKETGQGHKKKKKLREFIPIAAGTFLLESEQQIAVQMQFRLFSFALIVLNCMEYSNCEAPSQRWRRSKRGKRGWGGYNLQVPGQHPGSYLIRWLESLTFCGSNPRAVLLPQSVVVRLLLICVWLYILCKFLHSTARAKHTTSQKTGHIDKYLALILKMYKRRVRSKNRLGSRNIPEMQEEVKL